MKRNTIQLPGFSGLELDKQPLLAAQAADGRFTASVATNVSIDQVTREVIKSRGSSSWYDVNTAIQTLLSSTTAERAIGVMEYKYQSGAKRYIVRTARGFYLINSTFSAVTAMNAVTALPGSIVQINEGLQKPSYAQIGRHLVVVDGSGAYYWDGESTNVATTRLLEPPNSWSYYAERPKLEITNTASTMSNNKMYSVMMTFYNGTIESPPLHCGSIRTTATDECIKVSTGYAYVGATPADGILGNQDQWMPLPVGTTYVRFYVQGHNTTDKNYYYNSQVAVDAAAVDTELTANILTPATTTVLPTFQGPPGGVSVVCEHVGRAFYSGSPGWPVRLWFSEPGQPFTIKGTSWIDVGDFSDPIVGLVSFPYGSQLLGILKKHSVWSLSGFDDQSFLTGLQPETTDIGCIAPHAVFRKDRTAFFLGTGGIYAWDQGAKPVDITPSIRSEYLAAIRGAA